MTSKELNALKHEIRDLNEHVKKSLDFKLGCKRKLCERPLEKGCLLLFDYCDNIFRTFKPSYCDNVFSRQKSCWSDTEVETLRIWNAFAKKIQLKDDFVYMSAYLARHNTTVARKLPRLEKMGSRIKPNLCGQNLVDFVLEYRKAREAPEDVEELANRLRSDLLALDVACKDLELSLFQKGSAKKKAPITKWTDESVYVLHRHLMGELSLEEVEKMMPERTPSAIKGKVIRMKKIIEEKEKSTLTEVRKVVNAMLDDMVLSSIVDSPLKPSSSMMLKQKRRTLHALGRTEASSLLSPLHSSQVPIKSKKEVPEFKTHLFNFLNFPNLSPEKTEKKHPKVASKSKTRMSDFVDLS